MMAEVRPSSRFMSSPQLEHSGLSSRAGWEQPGFMAEQHIKRPTERHTRTLPLTLRYQGHVNHHVVLDGTLWNR